MAAPSKIETPNWQIVPISGPQISEPEVLSQTRRHRFERIRDVASRQYGLVTAAEVTGISGDPGLAARLADRGYLVRRYHGVYAVGTSRLSVRGELLAAVLACGGKAVISHASAATLWRLSDLAVPIHLTRPPGGSAQPAGLRIHKSQRFGPADRTSRFSIPVTSVSRTLFDLAATMALEDVEDLASKAFRRRLITVSSLREVAARNRSRPGAVGFRELLDEIDLDVLKTRSRMERAIIRLCRDGGVKLPRAGVKVAGYEVDLFWPDEGLILEFDSRSFHMDPEAFEKDRLRDARHEWHGYRTFRVTYRMLRRNPEAVSAQIRRMLELGRQDRDLKLAHRSHLG